MLSDGKFLFSSQAGNQEKKATHPTSYMRIFQCSVKYNALAAPSFTPVLLFPFAGIVVGIAIMLRNPMFVGESADAPDKACLPRSFTSLRRAAGPSFVICR